MSWPPVDSSEARELREQADDPESSDGAAYEDAVHARSCRRGWVGEDGGGRPIPCRRCKPHLFQRTPAAEPDASESDTETSLQRGEDEHTFSHGHEAEVYAAPDLREQGAQPAAVRRGAKR